MPKRMVTSNVLFLGETNLGNISIIDLIAGSEKQESTPHPVNHRALVGDVRHSSVTLHGKVFMLYALPAATNETASTPALWEGIEKLFRTEGVHLLVYCMTASHSTSWIHHTRDAIASCSNPSLRIPTVAVISGPYDEVEQENWWSSNQDAFANQGPRFDDHAVVWMTIGAGSLNGDHISKTRDVLHALILRNCNSEAGLSFQQRALSYPVQTFFRVMSRKTYSPKPLGSEAIDIVLLGETGVGKSSLINLIVGKNVAAVSPDTVACTMTVNVHTFEEKGRTFHLYDTPGLVDPQMGVEDFVDPIVTIQRKIRSIGNGKGPHLLLFCIDSSRPTTALQRNYHLLCKMICGGKISAALAITKLAGQDADQWWDQHKVTIREFGIDCPYVGLVRIKKHLDPGMGLEEQSRKALLSLFTTCTQRTSLQRISMRRIIDSFTAFTCSPERILMDHCKLDEHVARKLISRLAGSDN